MNPSSQPENQLDNDKDLEALVESLCHRDPSLNEPAVKKEIRDYTQSKLKAFAEEVEKAIGEDLPLDDKTKATDNTSGRTGRRARNQLRKQLREALKAIKEKYEL